jgi:pimeloyl-ACP methyl ester carboxylesterase
MIPRFLRLVLLIIVVTACARQPETQTEALAGTISEPCRLSAPGLAIRLAAQCGSLEVPEDHSTPGGKQIAIHFAVLPAVSRTPKPDPLVLLAGGPGEAGTQAFVSLLPAFERINQHRAIILVDQRGTGQSNALTCAAEEVNKPEADTQAELRRCLESLPSDPRFYTTTQAAADLEALRQALGYTRINVYGASYGTRLALEYARRYPEATRSLILDGVVPLDWTLGPDASADAQRALDLVFNRCSAEPECSAYFPGVADQFRRLLASLEQSPLKVTIPHPSTHEATEIEWNSEILANGVRLLSYTPETAALLPLLIHTAAQGNVTPLAAQAYTAQENLSQALNLGLYFSVICAEDAPFIPASQTGNGYLGQAVIEGILEACAVWPQAEIPADFKKPLTADIPTLLLSGEADPVTPPENAKQAAKTLSNSLLVTFPGQGHINVIRGCAPDLVRRFLEAGATTGLDTRCADLVRPQPFFVNFNGPVP